MHLSFFALLFLALLCTVEACTTITTDGGTDFPEPCVSPWKYRGKTYTGCTRDHDPDNKLWCSVETDSKGNHILRQQRWGYCDEQLCSKAATTKKPARASNGNVNSRGEKCTTVGGNSPNRPCVFPFKFRGVTYDSCTLISADDGKPWCSTSVDSSGVHRKGRWGHCSCSRDQGSQEAPRPRPRPSPRPTPPQKADTCQATASISPIRLSSSGTVLPRQGQCYSDANFFVINGENATVNEYPFAVLFGARNRQGTMLYFCGGSLINRRYVLTAAHCLDGPAVEEVVLGELDISQDCDCDRGKCSAAPQRFTVTDTIIHERYNLDGERHNDIGLLRLDRPAELSPSVEPICLPLSEPSTAKDLGYSDLVEGLSGRNMTVVGWGRTQWDDRGSFFTLGASSPILQKGIFPVIDPNNCTQTVADRFNSRVDKNIQVCAGKEGSDSCRGDSGGPLFAIGGSGLVYQIGIVSYGSRRCGDGNPGVYTRVSGYTEWIRRNLKK